MNRISMVNLFFLLMVPQISMATINTNSVEVLNASRVVKPDTSSSSSSSSGSVTPTGNIKIYGGVAGPTTGCTTTDVCDNCADPANVNAPCNTRRILPDSYLEIQFQTDNTSVFTGSTTFYIKYDTTTITPDDFSQTLAANSTLFVKVKWSTLCLKLGSDANCTALDGPKSIQVGLSAASDNTLDEYITLDVYVVGSSTGTKYFTACPTENTATESDGGYCYFEVERGDQKVYISNEIHGPNFDRAPGGVKYQYMRIYYAPSDVACSDAQFQSAVTSASNFKDLTFSEQNGVFTLDDPMISGLTNGTIYYFRMANVDEAGNVFYFSADKTTAGPTPAQQLLDANLHCKIPSEVVGMLDGKECFIATAAFGSPMAPQLQILRAFRDQFLKTNFLGKWFVKQYYRYSPRWALKIRKKDSARAAVRVALSPIISTAQWVVLYGLPSFILLSALGFIGGFWAMRRLLQDHD